MTKKAVQEQLSKFSLLGELPKVENGLEEVWENLKKSTEPFTAQDIIRQQQETINRQQVEIIETRRDLLNEIYALEHQLETTKAEAIKEFAYELKIKMGFKYALNNTDVIDKIDNLVKEMVGEE